VLVVEQFFAGQLEVFMFIMIEIAMGMIVLGILVMLPNVDRALGEVFFGRLSCYEALTPRAATIATREH
jgi:hypothetical protein